MSLRTRAGQRSGRALAALGAAAVAATLAGAAYSGVSKPPQQRRAPTVSGHTQVGATLVGHSGVWTGGKPIRFSYRWLRCNRSGGGCQPIAAASTSSLVLTPPLAGATVRLQVSARNAAGGATGRSIPTRPVLAAQATGTTGLNAGMYFSTLAAGSALPRSDALCASLVTPRPFDPRPENNASNHTVYPAGSVHWPTVSDQTYWKKWIANRDKVSGNYTGTTDEIIRWAACKWGLDENTLRAVAVQESDWHESEVGDNNESFGIMQVKDHTSDGQPDIGGYPATSRSTALNVDVYGAWERSCLDGAFYDGGNWLYGGKKVTNDLWGCVGAWFSGDWHDHGGDDYASQVKQILANKGWLHLGR